MNDALIVDIDGTLAHHFDVDGNQTRGHHEYHLVGDDRPDHHIINLVRLYKHVGYKIIITTGRPDSRKGVDVFDLTQQWLIDNEVPFDHIFMREGSDYRPDFEVKKDIYNANIAILGYNIDFALDDRNQIVDMWREMGIKTLQVEPGNF
tara:strand:+ start:377 stop:823 length:447 start_codon:yes stop_codon:yes gene_type:complete